MEKRCQLCGRAHSNKKSVYCNRSCSLKAYNIKNKAYSIINCEHCGRSKVLPNHMAKKQRFCSLKCAHNGNKTGSIKKCEMCGKEYYTKKFARKSRRFCSLKCVCDNNKKKVKLPKKEQMHGLLQVKCLYEIAKMYSVDHNIIRRHCRENDVHIPSSKERHELKKARRKKRNVPMNIIKD